MGVNMRDLRGFWKDQNAAVAKPYVSTKGAKKRSRHQKSKAQRKSHTTFSGDMVGRFVGSQMSRIVHSCGCEYATKIMRPELFTELFDALGQGYREGSCCLGDREHERHIVTKEAQQQIVAAFAPNGCSCCGYTRKVQRAHICPRTMGGKVTIPLCPNCHKLYDDGDLSTEELQAVVRKVQEDFGEVVASEVSMFHGAVRHSRRNA